MNTQQQTENVSEYARKIFKNIKKKLPRQNGRFFFAERLTKSIVRKTYHTLIPTNILIYTTCIQKQLGIFVITTVIFP